MGHRQVGGPGGPTKVIANPPPIMLTCGLAELGSRTRQTASTGLAAIWPTAGIVLPEAGASPPAPWLQTSCGTHSPRSELRGLLVTPRCYRGGNGGLEVGGWLLFLRLRAGAGRPPRLPLPAERPQNKLLMLPGPLLLLCELDSQHLTNACPLCYYPVFCIHFIQASSPWAGCSSSLYLSFPMFKVSLQDRARPG